jgi:CheY-like chemotaxis protein
LVAPNARGRTSKAILVVEDEPDMRLLVRIVLRADPRLDVHEASSAHAALAILDFVEPGVIVLDHGLLGDLSGLEAAPLLKAKSPTAKILLFTALDLRREASQEPAVDEFLRKDGVVHLLTMVQRLLDLEA